MSRIHVARQPIFELGRGVFGYELLYRRDSDSTQADGDQHFMSADVIANSVLGMGLESLTCGRTAFVNFTRAQLLNESWSLSTPKLW